MALSSAERAKKWRHRNPKKAYQQKRKSLLKCRYGLTEEQYLQLWNEQGGLCPICNLPLNSISNTHIDHNHATGDVRGLLHSSCNLLVGKIETNKDKLDNIIIYLEGDSDASSKNS